MRHTYTWCTSEPCNVPITWKDLYQRTLSEGLGFDITHYEAQLTQKRKIRGNRVAFQFSKIYVRKSNVIHF